MTRQRMIRFVRTFRNEKGQLPTLRNLEDAGYPPEMVAAGVKSKAIAELYVTMTTGAVVKGYRAV